MIVDTKGFVAAVTGSSVRATANLPDPTKHIGVQSIIIQPHPSNAAIAYVGTVDMNTTTGVGVWGVIPKPASATTGPFAGVQVVQYEAPAGLNLADVYINGATSDKFIVTAVQG